jgi:transcriptional regulator with XRE-family HTH domain
MGTYLRRLRDQAGLSQRDLARRLGCQQPAISRLEAGEVRPNIATLQRIAEALGLQLELRMVDLDEALTSGVPVAFS